MAEERPSPLQSDYEEDKSLTKAIPPDLYVLGVFFSRRKTDNHFPAELSLYPAHILNI